MNEIQIKETDCFGVITKDSLSYDDFDFFGDSLILFQLYKIKCYIKENKGIYGFQLIYKLRDNQKQYTTINVKVNGELIEQEFCFEENEMITNIIIFRKEYLQGFEITTNNKRSYRFGIDAGEKITLNEFSSNKNLIIGFYLKFDKNTGVSAIGFYYIDKKVYSSFLCLGFFYLRAKLCNTNFRDNINKNITKYDYYNKALIKTCALPKNVFSVILKYLIN